MMPLRLSENTVALTIAVMAACACRSNSQHPRSRDSGETTSSRYRVWRTGPVRPWTCCRVMRARRWRLAWRTLGFATGLTPGAL
jgi:hypothetical protein